MKTEECCRWCGSTEKDDIAKDGSGFWCADCDGFTYYDNEKKSLSLKRASTRIWKGGIS